MFTELLQREVRQVMASYGMINLFDRLPLLANLVFVYHAIKASRNLCLVATEEEHDKDIVAYLEHHAEEEKDHDRWLREDLKSEGIDPEKTTIPASVVEMVGGLYYLIYHVEPAALLGYMLVMESFPLSKEVLESLETVHGTALLRTLRYHSEHDPEHSDTLKFVIEQLPEHRRWIVSQTAIKTAHYIGRGMSGVSYGRPQ
jgi:hypothetical protein